MADLLPYNFTDLDYLTPRGVRKALNTSLIDGIWSKVEGYRLGYAKPLNLRTAGQTPYRYIATEGLNKKYEAFLEKLKIFKEEYGRLSDSVRVEVNKTLRFNALKAVAAKENIKASDIAIKAIVNGVYREDGSSTSLLLGYRDALMELAVHPSQTPSEEFLVKEFNILYHTDELVSFYRLGASNESFTKIQVGAVLSPTSDQVPYALNRLHRFLIEDPTPMHLKATLAPFLLYGMVPFETNNFSLACLYGKNAFGMLLGEAASVLPMENLLLPGVASFDDIFTQSLKSGDATYLLCYGMRVLSENIDACLDLFVRSKRKELADEFVSIPKEEQPKPKLEPAPAEPKVEKTEIVEVKAKEEAPKRAEVEAETISSIPNLPGDQAIKAPKSLLSDKEVKETAKYLRESHPVLSKGQCLFYASHCTMGRYYSIHDYKKTIKCAYETARTSMDKLAAEGFYKKYKIKNKFVYTPIKQGD